MRDHLDFDLAPVQGAPRSRWPARLLRLIVAGLLLVAGAALVAGLHRQATPPATVAAPPMPVATLAVRHEAGHARPVAFAGRLEPARRTRLAFEEGGRVAEVLAAEGARVAEGAPLARLDTALLDAERTRLAAQRDRLAAARDLAVLTWERQRTLSAAATTAQRLDEARLGRDQAEAALAETAAALAALDVRRAKAVLHAPWPAVVAARHLDEGAIAAAGAPVLDLLEADRAEARIGVTPDVAATLVPGSLHTLADGDRTLTARLVALRPDIDPATRTVAALFALEGPGLPPFGTVLRLEVALWEPTPGFWVPLAALTDGGRGLWAVQTVSGGTVGRELVQILAVDGERAFVRGALPDGAQIMAGGGNRVTPGQAVAVLAE